MFRPHSSILLFSTLLGALIFTIAGSSRADTWPLIPSDPDTDDYGWDVDIYGDVAIVSDISWADSTPIPSCNNYQGAAYIFRWDGVEWVEEDFIFEAAGDDWDNFGVRVAITNEFAFAVVPWSSKIVVFRHDGAGNWDEYQIINESVASFGGSIEAKGNYLVVGAPDADGATGRVYIYNWNGVEWAPDPYLPSRQPYLTCGGDECYRLGRSVAVRSNGYIVEVLAGAPRYGVIGLCGSPDDVDPVGHGAAYLWELNKMAVSPSWSLSQTFRAHDVRSTIQNTYNGFGQAVALDHDVAITAYKRRQWIDGDLHVGGVYIYERDNSWQPFVFIPEPFDCITNQTKLGWEIAIEGDVALATNTSGEVFEYHYVCSWLNCGWRSGGFVHSGCAAFSMDSDRAVCGNNYTTSSGEAEIFDDF